MSIAFDGTGTFGGGGSEGLACGCTDDTAVNYDASAQYDDGSCEYEVLGCTDEMACNYDMDEHRRRLLPDAGRVRRVRWRWHPSRCLHCDGNVLDECGVCGGDGIPAGDCDCNGNQEDALGVCGGDSAADADMDGICDDEDDRVAFGRMRRW